MARYIAKRIRFRNGERLSVLTVAYGLPVHEATLYLDSFRRKGRAANTIHFVCCTLALLYRELDRTGIDLMDRLGEGRFLAAPDLGRLASLAQLRMADMDEGGAEEIKPKSNVINMARISLRLKPEQGQRVPVDVGTQASRLRYMAGFLAFVAGYVAATLPAEKRTRLEQESAQALEAFRAQIPPVSKRAKLDARVGLSSDEQDQLVRVVHPDSPDNPWSRGFVRRRNWLIVVLLLATGMRRGELLGLQIKDLNPREPKLRIIRRADAAEDSRTVQPNTKTNDREIELKPSILKALWQHINEDRRSIRAARKIPQIFVSDEGEALSGASIDKLFVQLRNACPGLPASLTSHVMRHTWNERFSEQADALGLSDVEEQQARNQQQGWSENSKSAATYTRRHTAKKGNEISLKLQERLDEKLQHEN
jgi:integrase